MSVAESEKRSSSTGRPLRSLVNLQANASTSRTLNLAAIWVTHQGTEGYNSNPFFRNSLLNRSIVLKHRVRNDERDIFPDGRSLATKIILPIDLTDLRAGGRSFFVGQIGYLNILEELFGGASEVAEHDERLLAVLDSLPSLDPFLMRERLRRDGYTPDRCYFGITASDAARMFKFACDEVSPLIGLAAGDRDGRNNEGASKLAAKILDNAGDSELEPLRLVFGMDKAAFEEGVFSWKGFIYYKWLLINLLPTIGPVMAEIAAARPTGSTTFEDRAYIQAVTRRLNSAITRSYDAVRLTLKIYDDAYADLTRNHHPQAFREFLAKAPTLFYELGDRLGAIQHILTFWRYRIPADVRPKIDVEELLDLLADFESSLNTGARAAA